MKEPMLLMNKPKKKNKASFVLPDLYDAKADSEYQEICYILVDLVKAAHIEHVNTREYTRHMALNELYEGLPGEIDPLLEMVVLHYGEICKCSCPEKFDEHFELAIHKVEYLMDTCSIGSIETTLGDIQKFLDSVKYKLERLK